MRTQFCKLCLEPPLGHPCPRTGSRWDMPIKSLKAYWTAARWVHTASFPVISTVMQDGNEALRRGASHWFWRGEGMISGKLPRTDDIGTVTESWEEGVWMFGGCRAGFEVQIGSVVSIWVWLNCRMQVEGWIGSQVMKTFLYLSDKFGFHLKGNKGVTEGF